SRFDLPTALVPPCSSGNAPSSTISAHRTSTQKATMIGTSMRGRLTRRRAKIVAMLPQSGPVMAVATPTPDRWTPGHWSGALQKTNQLLVQAGFPAPVRVARPSFGPRAVHQVRSRLVPLCGTAFDELVGNVDQLARGYMFGDARYARVHSRLGRSQHVD